MEPLERGFDILSNKEFNNAKDLGSWTIYEPHVVKPVKVWNRVVDQSNGFKTMKGELNTNAMQNAAKTDTDFWNT